VVNRDDDNLPCYSLAFLSFSPLLIEKKQDLKTTAEMINLTVTVYMIFQGLSPSFWGSLSDSWGRRPVYLMTLFIYVMSCIGLAFSPNYTTLLVLRMLQAFGSSSVIAIGAGTIGKERNQGQFVWISHSPLFYPWYLFM
jgi:MFS family permease